MNKTSEKGPNLIPVVVIEFHEWSDLYFHKAEYDEMGYRKFIKDFCIPVGAIKKIHKIFIKPESFPTNEWEP